jgi:Ca2+-binding EF-hand superfamily protein
MNTKLTLLGLLSMLLLSGLAFSSPDDNEKYYLQRGPMPFEVLDLNGDGNITAEEHATVRSQRHAARAKAGYLMRNKNKAPVFEQADLDSSGAISRDELSKWQARRFQQRWQ